MRRVFLLLLAILAVLVGLSSASPAAWSRTTNGSGFVGAATTDGIALVGDGSRYLNDLVGDSPSGASAIMTTAFGIQQTLSSRTERGRSLDDPRIVSSAWRTDSDDPPRRPLAARTYAYDTHQLLRETRFGEATNTPGVVELQANEIRLSQATIDGPKTSAITSSMEKSGWVGEPVDVVRMPDGRLTAFDNKRIVAANDAGIKVQARVHEFGDAFPAGRLGPNSPGTWGEAVSQRIGNQKAGWQSKYPNGSPFTCRMRDC